VIGNQKSFQSELRRSRNTLLESIYALENKIPPKSSSVTPQVFINPDYKSIVENTRSWETLYDKRGNILYVSPGIKQVIGRAPSDYFSRKITMRHFVCKEDLEKAKAYFKKAKAGEFFNDIHFQFLHKDHRVVHVSISCQIVRDTHQKMVGFRYSIRDITKRKKIDLEHEFLSSITEQVSDSVIVTDKNFKIIFVNKATERLYGYGKKELLGKSPKIFNADPLAADIQNDIYRKVTSGKACVTRHLNRKKDKTTFICESKITPVKNSKGEIYCYCGLQRDVTEKEGIRMLILAERDLGVYLSTVQDLKQALRYILEIGLQVEGIDCGGIYLVDHKNNTLDFLIHRGLHSSYVSKVSHFASKDPEFKLVMKKKPVFFSYRKILGGKIDSLRKDEDLKAVAVVPIIHNHRVVASLNLGSHFQEYIPQKSKELIKAIADRVGGVILRLNVEEEFKKNAFHDSLTNIPNRRFFIKNLSQAMKRARRNTNYLFAVLFLDLDRFKDINDGLGHLTGDKVILQISQKLQTCLRANDTIARFGGDEFTILLDGINGVEDAIDAANRIQIVLSQSLPIGNRDFFITGSIGVLMYTNKYHAPEDMLRDADTAMYKAKLSGRARYALFDEHMHTSAVTRIHLENDLRKAVDSDELKIYYQPIVSLNSGQINGVEALLRWHHPQRGIILPSDFIPLAEETGVIVPLTEKIIKETSKQMKIWANEGHHLRFAINLSSLNLSQSNLSEFIEETLKDNHLDPGLIELEITETAAMKEFDLALVTLQRLRAGGSHISIDDFGVGYAPLVYLKQCPVSKIKLDITFVKDIPGDKNTMAITEAIIAMAHILNIQVIAEGVETIDQMEFLRKQQCDEIQGFLFSPAVPSSKISEYLNQKKNISHLFPTA